MMTFPTVLSQLMNTGITVLRPTFTRYATPSVTAGWAHTPKFPGGDKSSQVLPPRNPYESFTITTPTTYSFWS